MQAFKGASIGQVPELLSHHQNDQRRIDALERQFSQNHPVFAKFNADPKSAKPLSAPENAPENFMRPAAPDKSGYR